MHLRSKSKDEDVDPTTQKLMDQGVLKSSDGGKKGRKTPRTQIYKQKLKRAGKITYDFWSGVKYIVILSFLLWWIPLFGPMLSGYVGGRRTGGPKRGLLAAIVSLGLVGGVYYVVTNGLLPYEVSQVLEYPSAILAALSSEPLLEPYIRFLRLYWTSFFANVLGSLPFAPNSYILTAIFAYIGGVISLEKRKELSEAGEYMPSVNIDLGGLAKAIPSGNASSQASGGQSRSNAAQAQQSPQQRLQDLKAVQFNGGRPQKKAKQAQYQQNSDSGINSNGKKGNSSSDDTLQELLSRAQQQSKGGSQNKKQPVRHHANSEGDDWEFL